MMKNLIVIAIIHLVLLCSLRLVSCTEKSGPIFKTNLGDVKGSILTSDEGVEFFAFRGIPFAKPPVKELRFQNPQPVKKWDGILDATEDGDICIQYDLILNVFGGDEDCLYLNVYTPKVESQNFAEPMAVMFFIHGGGFLSGSGVSSLYGPERLLDKNIILVTINYRLGPFGFLSTLDENSPGNYGLFDQLMALQWVHDNIAAFGGDPNRVTLFGESAGGASVVYHLLSPLSKGLFHAAIPQSGSAITSWGTPDTKETVFSTVENLASKLNCPVNSNKDIVKCLKKRSALDITVKLASLMEDDFYSIADIIKFKPVVDIATNGKNAFLPDQPKTLLESNKFNHVPVISGVTADEGIIFLNMLSKPFGGLQQLSKAKLLAFLPKVFNRNIANGKNVLEKIVEKYFANVDESDAVKKFTAVIDVLSDGFMSYDADQTNKILTRHNVPTYSYKLTYRGTQTMLEKMAHDPFLPVKELQMVSHIDDLQYLFRCAYLPSNELSTEDKLMADIMLTLWTNFAKTKVPTLKGSRYNHPSFEWEPVSLNSYRYLNLTLKSSMVNQHLCFQYDAWKKFYASISLRDEL